MTTTDSAPLAEPTATAEQPRRAAWARPRYIATAIALYVVLTFSALLGFELYEDYTRLVDRARLGSAQRATALEGYVRLYFGSLDRDLRLFADEIRRHGDPASISHDEFRGLVQRSRFGAGEAHIAWARPLAAKGGDKDRIAVIGDLPPALGDPDALDVYTAQREGSGSFYIGIPRNLAASNEWVIVVSRRVEDSKGEFCGALIVTIPEAGLRGVYGALQVGNNGGVTLLRSDGLVLTRHPFSPQFLGMSVQAGPIIASPTPVGTVRTRAMLDRIDRFISYRKLPDLPLVAIVGIAADDALGDYTKDALLHGLASFTAMTTLLGLLYGFLRRDTQYGVAEAARSEALHLVTRTARQLQVTLDSLAEAVFAFDDSGRIQNANASAAKLFNFPREQMTGRSILSFLRLGDAPDLAQLDELVATTGVCEATGLGHDRRAFPVELRINRVGTDGRQLHVVSVTDVSERREATRQIEIRESRFHAIFDSATQAITLLRPDGVMLEANAALLERTGVPRELFVGKPVWDAPWWRLVPGGPDWVRGAARRAAAGEVIGHVFVAVDRTGKQVHIDYSMKPIRNTEGEVIYLLVEARDVTDYVKVASQRGDASDT